MGNFYTNYTVKGASRPELIKLLSYRESIVSPEVKGVVVVFDKESDTQEPSVIEALGRRISKQLSCVVFSVINHDDDILAYELIREGHVEDEYDSSPEYFDFEFKSESPTGPKGGNQVKLCEIFGVGEQEKIEKILRGGIEDYVFAFERHQELFEALGLPSYGVGSCYESFENDELPEGLKLEEVTFTNRSR